PPPRARQRALLADEHHQPNPEQADQQARPVVVLEVEEKALAEIPVVGKLLVYAEGNDRQAKNHSDHNKPAVDPRWQRGAEDSQLEEPHSYQHQSIGAPEGQEDVALDLIAQVLD